MLIFQDPNDNYGWYDHRFDRQIFIRFTDYLLFLGYIETNLPNFHRQIHLFLPDFQLQLVDTFRPQFNGTLKYIYCHDRTSVDLITNQYGRRADHKIFTTDELEFYLCQVTTEMLFLLSKQAPDGSDDRDQLATKAMQQLDVLYYLLKQLKKDEPGEQPAERQ
jgi:hypothetical protein